MRDAGVILREGFHVLVGDVASHRAMACKVARRRGMTVESENGIVAGAPRRSPRRLNDPSMICGYARVSTDGQYKRIGSQADPQGTLPC
jgi:hypothetical protein